MASKKLNKKALERLGSTPLQLLEQSFKNGGCVGAENHRLFWHVIVGDDKEFVKVMLTLLQKLKELGTTGAATGSLGHGEADTFRAIANTINYICLNYPFNASDARVLRERNACTADVASEVAKEALRTLKMAEEKDMLGPKINAYSTNMHSIDDIMQLKTGFRQFPTLPARQAVSAVNTFLYSFIKRSYLEDKDNRPQILKNVLDKFFQLPQVKLANPTLAGSSLMALFLLLRLLLTQGPVHDRECLERACTTIRPFFFWPSPYGQASMKMMELIENEKRVAGWAMWERLRFAQRAARFPPSLAPTMAETDEKDLTNYSFARSLPYLMTASRPCMGATIMGLHGVEEKKGEAVEWAAVDAEGNDPTTRAMVLLNTMAMQEGVGAGEEERVLANKLSQSELDGLWSEFLTYTAAARACDESEPAIKIRADGVASLKASLQASAGGGDCVSIPEGAHDTHFLPQAPDSVHYTIARTQAFTELVVKDVNATKPFPTTPFVEVLTDLINQANSEKRETTLHIVVAGGQSVLNATTTAYAHLAKTQPQLFATVQLRFLVVPFEQTLTAAYLARHDPWYARHVYAPFTAPFTLPWCKDTQQNLHLATTKYNPSPPGLVMRGLVEDYAALARDTTNIRIFQVEAWVDCDKDDGGTPADTVVPFTERVNFVFGDTSPEMIVRMTTANCDGGKEQTTTCDTFAYRSLDLSNVPIVNDPCWPADPTSPWLELHASAPSNSRRVSQLINDPRRHVLEVDVRCADRNGNFHINVDGYKWGHFSRIRVSAAWRSKEGGGEVPLVFPVASFFKQRS